MTDDYGYACWMSHRPISNAVPADRHLAESLLDVAEIVLSRSVSSQKAFWSILGLSEVMW